MKHLILIPIALLLSSCASDAFFADVLPPEPCDHYPTVAFEEVVVPRQEALEMCNGAEACVINGNTVIIQAPFVLFDPATYHGEAIINIQRRHEYGHINCPQWTHDETAIEGHTNG